MGSAAARIERIDHVIGGERVAAIHLPGPPGIDRQGE
jgi:hypothetical protein